MSPQLYCQLKKLTWPEHVNKIKLNKNVSLFAPNISTRRKVDSTKLFKHVKSQENAKGKYMTKGGNRQFTIYGLTALTM